jgi:hypothetical protein
MSSDEHSPLCEGETEQEDEEDMSDATDMGHFREDEDVFEVQDYGWPDKETAKLIELFREKPQLYDVSHKWYSHRDRKAATLANISSELDCSGK